MLLQLFTDQTLFNDVVQFALLLHRPGNSFCGLTGPAEKVDASRTFNCSSGILVKDPSAKSLPTQDLPAGIINRLFADQERQGAARMEPGIGRYRSAGRENGFKTADRSLRKPFEKDIVLVFPHNLVPALRVRAQVIAYRLQRHFLA